MTDLHPPTSKMASLTPSVRVFLFGLALALFGVTLIWATPNTTGAASDGGLPLIIALAAAFAMAESTALHVEIRKESHSLSLGSIPLLFGLVFTNPLALAAAYVAGGSFALLFVRRSGLLKTFWNSTLFVAQVGLGAFFIRSILGVEVPESAVEWLVPLGGVMLAELISLLAVSLVIMVVDTTFRPHLFADVGQSQILAVLAGTYTVTVAACAMAEPLIVGYALIPLVGVGILLRHTGQVSQRLKDVQLLHAFTTALSNERGARTIDTGLVELAQITRSRTAGLMILGGDDRAATLRVFADDRLVTPTIASPIRLLTQIAENHEVSGLSRDAAPAELQALFTELDADWIMATSVLGEADRSAVLFVCDRLGMRNDFNDDDRRLFLSLANNFSARLSNDVLVEQLENQARHDALTQLPNRLSYEVSLTAELARTDRSGIVVMLDLDRFKEINDSLGHDMGDRLLVEIANRLRSVARPIDLVARFGGDEFALALIDDASDPSLISEQRIRDIEAILTERIEIEGIRFDVGASLGVAQWPAAGTDSETLLRRADTAMYEAKRRQVGPVWYNTALDADEPRRLELYHSASDAFDNGELAVLFQPKISTTTGLLSGVEALVRWCHPKWANVPPDEFVPLMVHAGLVGRLTRFVINRSAEAAFALEEAGYPVPVAVNLTPRDLLDPTLVDDVRAILDRVGTRPDSLLVEITEDAMVVDIDAAVSVLNQLRAMGIEVAIDDFGTGYSSLQLLHQLPIDQLKIDRSFVQRMISDDSAAAIVTASINLAHDLALDVVAEGVETFDTYDRLTALGCDEIQGYLIEPALTLRGLLGWTHEWHPSRVLAARPEPVHQHPLFSHILP
jgi:diguanylate cyclase (GGDEF)-like protein